MNGPRWPRCLRMCRSRRHRFSPVRFVSAYNATGRSTQQTMMNGEMTRCSTNNGSLDASFRLCRNGCKRQSQTDCSNTEKGSHARHDGTSELSTVPKPQLSGLVPPALPVRARVLSCRQRLLGCCATRGARGESPGPWGHGQAQEGPPSKEAMTGSQLPIGVEQRISK